MNMMKRLVALTLLLVYFDAGMAIAADKPVVYQLHQGDTVLVSVWGEDSLKQQVVVLPDSSITLPLAGRVEVGGLSTPEVERLIAEKLKKFLKDPVVTVVIASLDGNRAYVAGKVLKPGPLIISGPTTVLQAISIANGFDKFANESEIKVIRTKPDGRQEVLQVHYNDIISGKDMSTNIQLMAGDTIVVP
ncbi:polysaccharide biosynthesis/export protein [mine drainage metagenome]|uniref:Polysaccharide biosynthesis/export protein n=1 Tax=mine drainage metagenome TaxID=410659 RepID=A0A1J5S3Z0_9ZZZZ